nr:MAG TPA: hypothetical protein [Caudoviricetes sp.]
MTNDMMKALLILDQLKAELSKPLLPSIRST